MVLMRLDSRLPLRAHGFCTRATRSGLGVLRMLSPLGRTSCCGARSPRHGGVWMSKRAAEEESRGECEWKRGTDSRTSYLIRWPVGVHRDRARAAAGTLDCPLSSSPSCHIQVCDCREPRFCLARYSCDQDGVLYSRSTLPVDPPNGNTSPQRRLIRTSYIEPQSVKFKPHARPPLDLS